MGWYGSADLGDLSRRLRKNILVPSSGWIGDIVTPISNVIGIWDIFLVAGLFVFSWTTIRTCERVVALILARVFDATIPLQHQYSERSAIKKLHHQGHLEQYWRLFYIGTAIEIAAYFLFHRDLFTLVTCFKTAVLTILWMGRNADGTFWTSGVRYVPKPNGGTQSNGEFPSGTSTAIAAPAPTGNAAADVTAGTGTLSGTPRDWAKQLASRGYDRNARPAMIEKLLGNPGEARKLMNEWINDTDKESRKKRNKDFAEGQPAEDAERKQEKEGEEGRNKKKKKKKKKRRRENHGQAGSSRRTSTQSDLPAGNDTSSSSSGDSGSESEGDGAAVRERARAKYFQRPSGMDRGNLPEG